MLHQGNAFYVKGSAVAEFQMSAAYDCLALYVQNWYL
jgi:hypothetical protein